ncbi:FtsX-like permease family protein [Streptomyces sp. NPDC004735]|uniref:FtsX-like permease family protein n=1 Tax=Streptomyces sp. NPDC004735 TaxID=3156654 RepID=UPI0033BC6CD7
MPKPGPEVVPRANSGSVERRCALDGDAKGNRGSKVSQAHRDGSVAVAVGIAEQDVKARTSGGAVVGDNLGAALDAAPARTPVRAQIPFLGVPGAVFAALLTAAVAGAGADRRRRGQALLRTCGLRPRQVTTTAGAEVGVAGRACGVLGVGIAALAGRAVFGAASFGASTSSAAVWFALALLLRLAVDADDRSSFTRSWQATSATCSPCRNRLLVQSGELLSQPLDRNHGCVVAQVAARMVQEVCAQVLQQ